jgi:hypothetical protein
MMKHDWHSIVIEAAAVLTVLTAGMTIASLAQAQVQTSRAAPSPGSLVKIESKIQVERTETAADGSAKIMLVDPATVKVVPGDRLVFVNNYYNLSGEAVTGFVVNNPVHPAVSLEAVEEPWAMVSVDGGKTFAPLAQLTISETVVGDDGVATTSERPAQPRDVTHIRWTFAEPIPAGKAGKISFRGVVK